jgi:NAD(P)-dependent dehydrogenase (short-subunit alcohol dehydrogenase family)
MSRMRLNGPVAIITGATGGIGRAVARRSAAEGAVLCLADREQARPGNVAYGAAKAGVHGMTLYLAKELSADNITVNCVAPGPIASPMTTNLPETFKALLPAGRLGRPEEVADAVTYLAGEQASFTTGEILDVNGGGWVD